MKRKNYIYVAALALGLVAAAGVAVHDGLIPIGSSATVETPAIITPSAADTITEE